MRYIMRRMEHQHTSTSKRSYPCSFLTAHVRCRRERLRVIPNSCAMGLPSVMKENHFKWMPVEMG